MRAAEGNVGRQDNDAGIRGVLESSSPTRPQSLSPQENVHTVSSGRRVAVFAVAVEEDATAKDGV